VAIVLATLGRWSARRWRTAAVGALATALLIGLPTDVIPNPVFGRPVPVTWWSYLVLIVTAILAGLLLGTYVREPAVPEGAALVGVAAGSGAGSELVLADDRNTRLGGMGGLLSFFAVGCPVCNKIVVIALGATGARTWFEPVQPLLAVASAVLLAVALRARLRAADTCPLPPVGQRSA
jgi:hypothetical protein